MSDILIIHINRKTGEYDRYELYPRDFEEKIPPKVEEWNNNLAMETTIKVYDDPILGAFANDVKTSRSRKYLISNLKDIANRIADSLDELSSWQDDIEEQLNELKDE